MTELLKSLTSSTVSTSAIPIAIIIWLIQKWLALRSRRREETLVAIAYLREIEQEVSLGRKRLRDLYCNGGCPVTQGTFHPVMPTANWNSVRAILPDDIYRRICAVANSEKDEESFQDLRVHLKNYYTVICNYGNKLLLADGTKFERVVVRQHLDGAEMVLGLLAKALAMMERNKCRWFWPR